MPIQKNLSFCLNLSKHLSDQDHVLICALLKRSVLNDDNHESRGVIIDSARVNFLSGHLFVKRRLFFDTFMRQYIPGEVMK